jgi:hypothetical protein
MMTARWLMVAAVGMLGSTWAQADSEPGHYTITLTDWDDNQVFNFVPFSDANPNDAFDTADFTNPDNFCPGFDFCGDPGFKFNGGGGSTPENGEFSFSTGPDAANSVVTLDFSNAGPPIDEVLIELTSNGGELNADQFDQLFMCDGDGLFQNCGFYINPANGQFEIAFWNPVNSNGVGIPTAVPEPSQWIILLLAFAAIIVARARKESANSSFAQTRRSICPARDS